MKQIKLFLKLIIIYTIPFSCKGQEKEKKQTITDNHITIINSGVYYYTPSLKKIDSPATARIFRVVVKKQEAFLALKKTNGSTFGTPLVY